MSNDSSKLTRTYKRSSITCAIPMTEASPRLASELVSVVVREQNLFYLCKSCSSVISRSDSLGRHTTQSHGFKIVGLPKEPQVLSTQFLDCCEVIMFSGSAVGKRKKSCTSNPSPKLARKKSASLGARDVVLARASSSSEAVEGSPGAVDHMGSEAQFDEVSNASFDHNDQSSLNLANVGFQGLSPMAGDGLEEVLQVGSVVEAEPPRLELVGGQTSAGNQTPSLPVGTLNVAATSTERSVVVEMPALVATGGPEGAGEGSRLVQLHAQVHAVAPNVELVVENIHAVLLSMPPPWQAHQVFEAMVVRYAAMDPTVLMGLIRACIRAAKALTTEVRYRSAGNWNYADAVRSSWI